MLSILFLIKTIALKAHTTILGILGILGTLGIYWIRFALKKT